VDELVDDGRLPGDNNPHCVDIMWTKKSLENKGKKVLRGAGPTG
jgi:hypothetical protein